MHAGLRKKHVQWCRCGLWGSEIIMTWQSRNAAYVIVGRAWLASPGGVEGRGRGRGEVMSTAVAFHENANTNI